MAFLNDVGGCNGTANAVPCHEFSHRVSGWAIAAFDTCGTHGTAIFKVKTAGSNVTYQ